MSAPLLIQYIHVKIHEGSQPTILLHLKAVKKIIFVARRTDEAIIGPTLYFALTYRAQKTTPSILMRTASNLVELYVSHCRRIG